MRIATFGAGRDFENFLLLMRSNQQIYDDEIVLVVDSDSGKWNCLLGEYTIENPRSLKEKSFDAIVITSLRYEEEIKKILVENYPSLSAYTIGEYREKKTIEYHYYSNLQKNKDKKLTYKEFNTNSMVIYTAIIGDYDELHDPLIVDHNVKYVCYTDQEDISSDIWEIRHIEKEGTIDKRLLTRRYKLLPHRYFPEYETSVWMDASMQITGSIVDLIGEYQVCSDMLFFPHEGSCIYDIAMGEQYREKKEILLKQVFNYYEDGFPINNGIIFGGFLARNHNQPLVSQTMEKWYEHVERYSKRDQISLPYVIWKTNITYDLVCDYIYKNRYYIIYNHKLLSYTRPKKT